MMDDKCKTCIYISDGYGRMCSSCQKYNNYVEDIFIIEDEENNDEVIAYEV